MNKYILSISLLAAFAVSCSVNEKDYSNLEDLTSDVFFAQFETPEEKLETKVYATEDLYIRWNTNDRITIFNKYTYNQEYRFEGETGDNSGKFKRVDDGDFVTGNALENIYAIYPYLESTKISDTGIMTMTLPLEQKYADNTFGLSANTMISASIDNHLMFKNVGGYLMLKLYGDDVSVSSISLKGNNGEKLSGKATITMPVNSIPSVQMADDAGREIMLICDTPVKVGLTAETATTFWMVVPPTLFSKGFTLTIKNDKNGVFQKTTSKSFEISRNKLARMSPLNIEFQSDPGDFSSDYLTFEILEDGTLSWVSECNGQTMPKTIEYSLNNGSWTEITSTMNGTAINVIKGDVIRFRGDNEAYGTLKTINSEQRPWYNHFRSSCQFKAYGNIMSLISSTNFKDLTTLTESCTFFGLFNGCTKLIDVSHLVLPAITLSERCYWEMFRDCTTLASAPTLPALELADYCYCRMFYNCKALLVSSDLPATSLASHCYEGMFYDCSNLASAPNLPATILTDYCYSFMFYECNNLINAPSLPATTLSDHCYYCMFYNCSNLLNMPELPATELADYSYYSMFYNCTNLKTIASLRATALAPYCCSQMFAYCTSLKSAPELLAKKLTDYCYNNMFFGCTGLEYIKCLATDISANNSTTNWTYNVSSSGVFVKDISMDTWPVGTNGIPKGWTIKAADTETIEAVDLGLSVKWASCNLGSSKPEECGDYYAWGETEPYYNCLEPLTWQEGKEAGYYWSSYKWCMGASDTITKYCCNSSDFSDNKTVLAPEDDAAHVNLGENWRMPTAAEWTELKENCSWTWTEEKSVPGYKIKSNITGSVIFLPVTGTFYRTTESGSNICGSYWSSTLCTANNSETAYSFIFFSSTNDVLDSERQCGLCVRAVSN